MQSRLIREINSVGIFKDEFISYLSNPSAFSARRTAGIMTHIEEIDMIFGGLIPGHLVAIVGPRRIGKTSLMTNMAANVLIKNKQGVLIFTNENSGMEIILRMLSGVTKTDRNIINAGKLPDDKYNELLEATNMIMENDLLFIDDSTDLEDWDYALRLFDLVERLRDKNCEFGLVLLENYPLLSWKNTFVRGRECYLKKTIKRLKQLALATRIPFVVSLETHCDIDPTSETNSVEFHINCEWKYVRKYADVIMRIEQGEDYDDERAEAAYYNHQERPLQRRITIEKFGRILNFGSFKLQYW